jgi:hypothetical protein
MNQVYRIDLDAGFVGDNPPSKTLKLVKDEKVNKYNSRHPLALFAKACSSFTAQHDS